MMETALIFDKTGGTLAWHEPPGRSSGSIPDSRDLWEFLWANREVIGGVAHTHPWDGPAGPSGTDTTTFRACEQGLGILLLWPVVTFTDVMHCGFNQVTGEYVPCTLKEGFVIQGLEELRERSRDPVDLPVLTTVTKEVQPGFWVMSTNLMTVPERIEPGRYITVGGNSYRAVRVHRKDGKLVMQVEPSPTDEDDSSVWADMIKIR
jgi:hypothetical protein